MKKKLLYITYNIVAVIILLLLFEFLVRLFIPEIRFSGTDRRLMIDSLYSSSAGLVANKSGLSFGVLKTTNELRVWKYKSRFDKNKKVLLYLGDSVTMGIGVEDDSTFAGKLSETFNLLNPSLIGYSSFDYLNAFNSFVLENENNFEYSDVIVCWTLNDVYSNFIQNDQPMFSKGDLLFYLIEFLRNNSKAYIFTKNLVSDRPEVYYKYDRQFYERGHKYLTSAVSDINLIADKCKEQNIRFTVLILPYEWQIRNYKSEDVFEPQKLLTDLLNKNQNINVVDCKEAFQQNYKRSKDFYLYGDGIHLSEAGHQLIAEFMKRKILKQ